MGNLWMTSKGEHIAVGAGVLDVGARRVLPGHLLRRSSVLSSLRPAADACLQRTAVAACSGEASCAARWPAAAWV